MTLSLAHTYRLNVKINTPAAAAEAVAVAAMTNKMEKYKKPN